MLEFRESARSRRDAGATETIEALELRGIRVITSKIGWTEGEMYARKAAVVTLALLLAAVVKAKSVPIGIVSSCKMAAIHGTYLVPGTTIFSGDTIDVGAQGSAWIALQGGGQVQVFENSMVLLTKSPDSIQVTVDRGQALTKSKGVVIHSVSPQVSWFQVGTKADQNKHKDPDCEVSKHSRRNRPCRDDID